MGPLACLMLARSGPAPCSDAVDNSGRLPGANESFLLKGAAPRKIKNKYTHVFLLSSALFIRLGCFGVWFSLIEKFEHLQIV